MDDKAQRQQATPRTHERIRASFERQGLMRHLGAELTEIEQGRVTIVLRSRPEVSQQHGYIHAGAVSSIADSAGGYAALTMFPDDAEVLTVEYKLNLLAPAAGEWIESVGTVVKAGRTLTVCTLEVFNIKGGERKLVAVGQQTLFCVRQESK
ncbi:PaaI family thioesterase [Cystobacter fuscus]|uniref:PaaI family thioesterase n=1 Tax=Cystobacter fuscus TaxID=43 RepID=UPI002B29F883|nr:PaaI family thioesterase [Cystobacter fuscus]